MKLNLSGHKNNSLEELGFEFPGTIQMDMEKSYEENLNSITRFLVNFGLQSNTTVTIALPGMSILASMTIIALHGITGQFPNIVTLIRNNEGQFVFGEEVDLQTLRNQVCRNNRENVVNL